MAFAYFDETRFLFFLKKKFCPMRIAGESVAFSCFPEIRKRFRIKPAQSTEKCNFIGAVQKVFW